MRKTSIIILMSGLMLCFTLAAHATTISFTSQNQDGNRWTNTYTVLNSISSKPIVEINIFFDADLYDNLAISGPDLEGWTQGVYDPGDLSSFGVDDGLFNALAQPPYGIASGQSLQFAVSFDWLVSDNLPGIQKFQACIADGIDEGQEYSAYNSIEADTGSTAPVPEPMTLVLLGTGLIGLAGLGKLKKRP